MGGTTAGAGGPAASAAASPAAALTALEATLGAAWAASPFAGQDRQSLVAVDHDTPVASGGSQVTVDVYGWDGAALVRQASVDLGQGGTTGLLLPAPEHATPISVVEVTGSAEPDFAVTTASANATLTTLVSDRSGQWQAVPWDTPEGRALGVPSATIDGTTVRVTFASCTPTCAQGGTQVVSFAYSGGAMVPTAG